MNRSIHKFKCQSGLPQKQIVCLGLFPSCQRTLLFDSFHVGKVNRATDLVLSSGGKAVNAALALARLGEFPLVMGFNGGATGQIIAQDLKKQGVACSFVQTPWPTRTCTTIVDLAKHTATELVEESAAVSQRLLKRLETRARTLLKQALACLITGTLPPALPADLWGRFARIARQHKLPCVVDTSGHALLATLPYAPLLVKINSDELIQTCHLVSAREATLSKAALQLTSAGAQWVLITRGSDASILCSANGGVWRIIPPSITPINSIGSGDCVNAGILHGHLNGMNMPNAVRFGLTCGSANALTRSPGDIHLKSISSLLKKCRIEPMR